MRRGTTEGRGERGHLMAGLMTALAIMLIFSTVIFQDWQEVARRDNEAEMIFRAQEIVRAIVRYRKDFGTSPEKLEDLMKPGPKGQYYLRHQYEDPLVKDGKWGLLYAGPGGAIIDPSLVASAEAAGLPGPESLLGNQKDPRMNPTGGALTLSPGQDPTAPGAQAGLRIAGVKSLCTDQPFRVYKGFTEYREWNFTYLDLELAKLPGQGTARPGQEAPTKPSRLDRPGPLNQRRR